MKRYLECLLTWVVLVSGQAAVGAADPGSETNAARPDAEDRSALLPDVFTPVVPLPAPAIVKAAEAYPGGGYEADNILDGLAHGGYQSEYASASKGTDTFIDFDFGKPTRIAAFKHVDRFDPATVDTAELLFSRRVRACTHASVDRQIYHVRASTHPTR